MLRIAIVEDDPKDLEKLSAAIQEYSEKENQPVSISSFVSGEAFMTDFKSNYDLVFLDIELKGMSGMMTAEKLRAKDPNVYIIFCTNVASLAVKGYRYDALDYFLKPVRYEDVALRLKKVVSNLSENEKSVLVSIEGGYQKLLLRQIYYIESFGHDIVYHCINENITAKDRKSMKVIESELLSYDFFRANVSYLINLSYILSIADNDITMKNGDHISISRNHKKAFLEAALNHLQKKGGVL